MHHKLAKEIIALKNADLALRDKLINKGLLGNGYHKDMEQLHISNALVLDGIIDSIRYPTIDKVGTEASAAAWIIIQHAISKPDFMKKCRTLLKEAVHNNKANPLHLAYLSDRIAVYENRPQLYGTQFDWDSNGRLSPQPYDDLSQVNKRRKSIGLNTLQEQTAIIRRQAKKENQVPPIDLKQHQKDYHQWRKKVGWIE